ncbi:hypothetical protein TNCV_1184571 [Trichonephila clavipes]|nr:hypothetical protein TNCV_1184571 [Trichonephila clavipes]
MEVWRGVPARLPSSSFETTMLVIHSSHVASNDFLLSPTLKQRVQKKNTISVERSLSIARSSLSEARLGIQKFYDLLRVDNVDIRES